MKIVDFITSRAAVRLARLVTMFVVGAGLFFFVRFVGVKYFLILLGLTFLAVIFIVILFIATDPFERKDP